MCKKVFLVSLLLAFFSALSLSAQSDGPSGLTPKEQMLKELDNLSQQISDLQTINDSLTSLSEDQKKSLEAQSEQLQSFASSLNFTSLENKVLWWGVGVLGLVAVVETGYIVLVK